MTAMIQVLPVGRDCFYQRADGQHEMLAEDVVVSVPIDSAVDLCANANAAKFVSAADVPASMRVGGKNIATPQELAAAAARVKRRRAAKQP